PGAIAAHQYADDARVAGPGPQVLVENLDHRQAQGIERLGRVQCGDADARAFGTGEYFAMNGHGLPHASHRTSMVREWDRARGRSDRLTRPDSFPSVAPLFTDGPMTDDGRIKLEPSWK